MHDLDAGVARKVVHIECQQMGDPVRWHCRGQPGIMNLHTRNAMSDDQFPPTAVDLIVVGK
jgi:hypothetical protein